MEKFLLEDRAAITREAVDVRPGCIVVAVRNYETLYPWRRSSGRPTPGSRTSWS